MANESLFRGVVKSFNGLKGFGFVTCDSIEGDAKFDKTALPRDAIELHGKFLQGRSVVFQLETKADGRHEAQSLQFVRDGAETSFPGWVKSYSEKHGYGFLESSCIVGDIRFDSKALQFENVMGTELKGQLVLFEFQELPDGKLRASSVQLQALAEAPAPKGDDSQTGVVKSYSEKHGYGFLESPSISGDIRFNTRDLQSQVMPGTELRGMRVRFQFEKLPDGKLRASNVQLQSGQGSKGGISSLLAQTEAMSWSHAGKGAAWMDAGKGAWGYDAGWEGKGASWEKGSFGKGGKGGGWDAQTAATGTVKSFSEKHGYGFITTFSEWEDVKFGAADVVGSWAPVAGTQVMFKMSRSNGRLSATEVAPASGGAGHKRPASAMDGSMKGGAQKLLKGGKGTQVMHSPGQRLSGTIKSFNAKTGFGFIASPGVSGDVFFSQVELPEGTDAEAMGHGGAAGVPVIFELMQGNDGRLKAQKLAF